MSDVTLDARNRWRSILPALGVAETFLTGNHGPCPACAGRDRFRFDDREGRGTFFCNNCGAGDGFKLLEIAKGWDFKQAAREVEAVIGTCPTEQPKAGPKPADVRKSMNNMWLQSHPLAGVSAARAWWMSRTGDVPACADLRATDELYHAPSKRRFPAMLALVRGADNKPVNMHRTYLTTAGAKAPVDASRMLMPIELPAGSAVRLATPTNRLGIAEGIETARAATLISGIPCWAALNAQNMAKWVPPAGVAVTVFGDNDESYTGAAAAYALARRLTAMQFEVDVQIPSARREDWNDVWLAYREHHPANTNDHHRQGAAA